LSSKLKFTGVKLQEEGGRISVSEGPTVRNDRASSDSRIIYLAYPVPHISSSQEAFILMGEERHEINILKKLISDSDKVQKENT